MKELSVLFRIRSVLLQSMQILPLPPIMQPTLGLWKTSHYLAIICYSKAFAACVYRYSTCLLPFHEKILSSQCSLSLKFNSWVKL